MRCIAGEFPKDPEVKVVKYGLVVQDLTVSGTFGKYAVIEWDGTNFKQVK